MSDDTALAVGHIPSGLFIVCAKDESSDNIDGYLASWVQQVSFSPLLVSLAIKPGRPAYEMITSGKTFTINVVGDKNKAVMKPFWSGYDPDKSPFDSIDFKVSDNSGVLLSQAKSVVECKMVSKSRPGDHEIVIAQVLNSYVLDDESVPVTHIRKSGLDY